MSAPRSMSVEEENEARSLCSDFMKFQELLKLERTNDDKIINLINSTIPSIESLRKQVNIKQKCGEIKSELDASHRKREAQIKTCIAHHAKSVEKLKAAKDNADPDNNLEETRALGSAQRKLRILQNEIGVEEIVQERSRKALHERCREFV